MKTEDFIWSPDSQRAVFIDFGAALNLAILSEDYFGPSGTPSYVPPEFLVKRKGKEGDVWVLGLVMLSVWGTIKLPAGK